MERDPDLAFDGENFLVVWAEGAFSGEYRVRASRVTKEGVVVDTGIHFGSGHPFETKPKVAFDGHRYLGVWLQKTQQPYGLFGRFITTDCRPQGDVITIRELSFDYDLLFDIAFLDGRYLIVWGDPTFQGDEDILGQLVARDGSLIGSVIDIATGNEFQSDPQVIRSGNYFLVVWDQEGTIMARWLDRSGQLIGASFPLSSLTPYQRENPAVTSGGGRLLGVWMEYRGGDYDIYGNLDHEISIAEGDSRSEVEIEPGIYDLLGRRVDKMARPGIYFILTGEKKSKVVLIR